MKTTALAGFALAGVLLTLPGVAAAQAPASVQEPEQQPAQRPLPSAIETPTLGAGLFPTPKPPHVTFAIVQHDLRHFFSSDTARVMATFAVAGGVARQWDRSGVEEAGELLPEKAFSVGNFVGSLYVQAGAGLATYLVGRTTNRPGIVSLGNDLLRAQLLSQMVVQGTKFAVGRQRPDASSSQSFPSGHTASTFATATVIHEHFGWKAGLPAYGLAGFVGASRMASDKHYLSDVLIGAGVGIAAGRTIAIGSGRTAFQVGVAPTPGGALMTFTRRDD